eukprot:gnl/MRDRNA2_/MRDRNA2_95415_c0_seq1.p1 gnl/MRDRNA2_/MRDRNA2_95415_c0~~gnl/MRDRNA2_/MRDRNA2_95415_c0_seq1.p1  ORF type:complete len:232 (-),score=69.10 gnl/MRDRNA2_/MRDRNA2_95415_c0_seq1:81-776(-)
MIYHVNLALVYAAVRICSCRAEEVWKTILQDAARFEDAGEVRDAAVAYRKVKGDETLPVSARALATTGVGRIAEREGHDGAAEEFYREALQLDPAEWNATLRLGFMLEKKAELDGAEELYRKVIAAQPANMEARVFLGSILTGKTEYPLSNPDDPSTWPKNFVEAIEEFNVARKIDPANGGAAYFLAALYEEAGNSDKAAELYELAEQLNPGLVAQMEKGEGEEDDDDDDL